MTKITKLALPVAGFGKRLRPLTLKTPKNLLFLNGKPLIEYVLEEAVTSGIKEVVLIVNPENKSRFEDYVAKNGEKFPFKFHIRVQETPGGNGHALLAAKDVIRNEPFAVRFCDDILIGKKESVLKTLIYLFNFYKSSVILLKQIPKNKVSSFGVVGARNVTRKPRRFTGKIRQITTVVEKPSLKDAPSNLIVLGGYVLTPSVFRNIQKVAEALPSVAADAIPINVGLQIELIIGKRIYPRTGTAKIKNFGVAPHSPFGVGIYGWEFDGKRLDCGTLKSFRETEKFFERRKNAAHKAS